MPQVALDTIVDIEFLRTATPLEETRAANFPTSDVSRCAMNRVLDVLICSSCTGMISCLLFILVSFLCDTAFVK